MDKQEAKQKLWALLNRQIKPPKAKKAAFRAAQCLEACFRISQNAVY
jgi:hypothetical protein